MPSLTQKCLWQILLIDYIGLPYQVVIGYEILFLGMKFILNELSMQQLEMDYKMKYHSYIS